MLHTAVIRPVKVKGVMRPKSKHSDQPLTSPSWYATNASLRSAVAPEFKGKLSMGSRDRGQLTLPWWGPLMVTMRLGPTDSNSVLQHSKVRLGLPQRVL